MKPAFRPARALLALVAVLGLALPLSSGCSSGLEPEQCEKFRSDSFDIINKAQHCNDDKDCRQSEWPGCAKPLSNESFGKITAMRGEFQKGKCEEKKPDCKEPPVVYCKQGLCVHREKGTPENMGAPSGEIIIK
ncbi:MAG: hypothetical protein ABIV93_00835 [Byssovorax sp.]